LLPRMTPLAGLPGEADGTGGKWEIRERALRIKAK
jgi:hypothetical protein